MGALIGLCFMLLGTQNGGNAIRVFPAPPGEPLSKAFAARVNGRALPVYLAKVAARDPERRDRGLADFRRSGETFDFASFASFDMKGMAEVAIALPTSVRSVRILPTSAGIEATIVGKTIRFRMSSPRPLTIEVNGDACGSLHLFANPFEKDVPKPTDPNVIYYGPGIHEIEHLVVPEGKTLYVAGGAILRCGVGKDETGWEGGDGVRGYPASIELSGKNASIRGRGIVDGAASPVHSRNLLSVKGQGILVEGVILRDAATWTMPTRQSDRVTVRNVKILGYRANSDGIDVCNSRDVAVEDCFLRTMDDLIVVKTDAGQGPVQRVAVRRCVLWNSLAHALSLGAELREAVDDVTFEDCDVVHDTGREWALRVFHCDAAAISNVRFRNIRVEEGTRLLSLWIGETAWTRDRGRGTIRGVTVENVRTAASKPQIEVLGFDAAHPVENVSLDGVFAAGRPIARADVTTNPFVRGLVVRP